MTTTNEQMLRQTEHLVLTAASANPTLRSTVRASVHRDILAALMAGDVVAAGAAIELHYQDALGRLSPALEWFEGGFGAW
jgi:DNA-binding GntR family transcriptional regulator